MNKILSTSVTSKQYDIIQKMAETNNTTISKILKESVRTYITMYYFGNMLSKLHLEPTLENMERNSMIMAHAEEMMKLMTPYFEKALSTIPKSVIEELEIEGVEISKTIKLYDKMPKRGRPPALQRGTT